MNQATASISPGIVRVVAPLVPEVRLGAFLRADSSTCRPPRSQNGGCVRKPAVRLARCGSGFVQHFRLRRHVPFCRIDLALPGGPSRRDAEADGSGSVLLERNPPNRPLVPSGTPALWRESNPAPHKTKGTKMPSKTAQPAPQTKQAAASKLPVKTFRLGRIKAAVWENESDSKKFYNVTFARTYVDEAKNYHDTDSFGRDDLPLVAKLADQAHTFIFERLAEARSEQGE